MLRRKPPHLILRLILLAACIGLLAWFAVGNVSCPVRRFLGFPCPGCGLSRAWLAALDLDLAGAFRYHPMFWCVPVAAVYILWDGKLFADPRKNRWLGVCLMAGLLLCWLFRILQYVRGELPI